MTLDLLKKSGKNLTVLKDFLLHHEGGYIPIVFGLYMFFADRMLNDSLNQTSTLNYIQILSHQSSGKQSHLLQL